MDSSTLTHVAAIAIGVLVTLFLVNGGGSKSSDKDVGGNAEGAVGGGGGKKKKKKRSKGGGGDGASTGAPAPAPEAGTSKRGGKNKKGNKNQQQQQAKTAESTTAESEKAAENGGNKNGKKKNKKNSPAANGSNNNNNNNKENSKNNANGGGASNTVTTANDDNVVIPPELMEDGKLQMQAASQKQQEEEWVMTGAPKKKKKGRPKPAAASPAPAKVEAAPIPGMAPTTNKSTSSSSSAAAGGATANATAEAPAPAVPDVVTDSVSVDARKVGIIIGPKGATMQAIQEATGCKLDVNAPPKDDTKAQKAGVVVTGPDKESIQKAKKAITELATKGYARLLQSENFGEYSTSVHPRYLSEIVGPRGATIKALQETLDVKITIPSTDWKPNAVQVGHVKPAIVGIAGSKENCKKCKEAIKELTLYHHSDVTHPGMIHEEVYVPQEFFHCVIGPRGSEIKHIRGNFKVDVYMPNKDAANPTENVIVVGRQSNVDRAITYIQTLMDRDAEQRERKYNDEFY